MSARSKLERKSSRQTRSSATAPLPVQTLRLVTKRQKSERKSLPLNLQDWWASALVTLVVLFFGLIRIRLLDFPLERDEGEYAYAGQLVLHAIAPYRYCYSMKLPGTAAAYALLTAIFGQTAVGVHLGLLLVNSSTTVLIYLLAKKLFDRLSGVVASAIFAFLSLEPSVLGFAGHATQFVVLPAVAGILLLLRAIETSRLKLFFWSGLSLGVAFLMKQPGLFFVFFAAFYLACSEWMRGLDWRRFSTHMLVLLSGAVLPFALTCLFMAGIFSRFWFWTFSYASEYGNIVSFSQGFQIFVESASHVVSPAFLIWIIAAMGVVAVFWGRRARVETIFILGFLIFSFAAVCPGYYFRQHYFVLLLPAVALLCGLAVSRATALIRESSDKPSLRLLPMLLFVAALGISVLHDAEFFFLADPVAECHNLYGNNPFPEAPRIAEFIRSRSVSGDRIAVIGSEPEIYFYSGLRSATGYVYTYPLMEPQPFATSMQHEMESEIENAMPRFMVFADVPTSWLSGPQSDLGILTWAEKVARTHYQLVGIVDLLDRGTEFRWDEDARNYKARSKSRVLVFQRS
jgi:Dolichyl-phosphate-mannose-protein mannosyltransferase